VLTAASGEEALDLFGEHIDFAFFDRRMPGMSGDEAIQALRDQSYQTPIGIISAVDPDANLSVNPDVYLNKPVTKEQVQAAINQYTTK
jgi:CheY-like chemotaxis protein